MSCLEAFFNKLLFGNHKSLFTKTRYHNFFNFSLFLLLGRMKCIVLQFLSHADELAGFLKIKKLLQIWQMNSIRFPPTRQWCYLSPVMVSCLKSKKYYRLPLINQLVSNHLLLLWGRVHSLQVIMQLCCNLNIYHIAPSGWERVHIICCWIKGVCNS